MKWQSKAYLTTIVLCWSIFLAFANGCLDELSYEVSRKMDEFGGMEAPAMGEHFAIPVIGGLKWGKYAGPTIVTFLVWFLLFAWPIATLIYILKSKNEEKARNILILSQLGYSVLFVVITFLTAFGLWLPFCTC